MRLTRYSILAGLLISQASGATLVGLWEFENAANLGEATIGADLTLNGTITSTAGVGGDGAANVARTAHITVSNSIGANGAGSPTRTNQFTIVVDFMIPDFTDGGDDNGQFTGLFEFGLPNSDGDYFIRKQGGQPELGVGDVGYVGPGPAITGSNTTGTFLANTFYRLVYAVDSGGTGRTTYLNGTAIGNNNSNNTIDRPRGTLGTSFGVFQDNTANEQSAAIVSNIALFDGQLTASEVAALGSAGSPIPEPSVAALLGMVSLFGLRRRR